MQIQFDRGAGSISIVEVSTNLLDWKMIGVAKDKGDGSFDFEDADASQFTSRFYRIVSP